jgi:ABC-type antimicrobial peptide transport system permease subunit
MVFTDQTADLTAANAAATVVAYYISPEYFQAAGTALQAGRGLSWHDDKNSIPVAVVNRKFAEKIFGSADNAIGRYYKMKDGTRTEVVGIVEDGKYGLLTEKQQSAMFLPVLQSSSALLQSSSEAWLVVRSNADSKAMGMAIRNKLHDLDSALPCFIETWDSGLGLTMFPARMAAISLGVLGILGAVLSVTGIFGVAANAVSKRRRELGIRVALGAKRSQVSRAVLARPFKLLAFGSAVGLLLGILASGVVGAIVYDATVRDPLVLGGVVLAMALIGLLGTWIPARRALSIDASKLLRED